MASPSRQYVWRVPGGRITIVAIGEEDDAAYFIDNDRELRKDTIQLVAMSPRLIAILQAICDGVSFYELAEADREALRQLIAKMKGEG